jgi:hypothetical protein
MASGDQFESIREKAAGSSRRSTNAANPEHGAVISSAVLTSLRVRNFKRLEDAEIELGKTGVLLPMSTLIWT